MSEEEKAIETLKEVASDDFDTLGDEISPKMAQNILNVINKQQKEIKKEKNRIMELAELLDKQENEIKSLEQELEIQEGCSISKDKIREKIKAFQNIKKEIIKNEHKLLRASITYDIVRNDYCEKMLQELLEENNEKSNTL